MKNIFCVLFCLMGELFAFGAPEAGSGGKNASGRNVDIRVGRFVFRYMPPDGESTVHPELPALDALADIKLRLERRGDRWLLSSEQPENGGIQWVSLGGDGQERRWSATALQGACREVVLELNRRGVYGVLAAIDPDQIDLTVSPPLDLRTGSSDLRILVYYSTLAEVRLNRCVVAKPGLLRQPGSVAHRILKGVPLEAGGLLRRDHLQAYFERVNHFGGRRVDAAVSPGEQSGTVNLTLNVAEQKRATAYIQTSNTGTGATGLWRSRIGGELRQLAGMDDALRVDYSTTDFERYQAVALSGECGFIFPDILKGRLFTSHSKLSLADLGQTGLGFESVSQTLGAQLIWTPWVLGGYPISWTGSLHFMDARVRNSVLGAEGGSGFWVSSLGIGTERQSSRHTSSASLAVEYALTSDADRDLLGRVGAASEFWLMRWNFALARRAGQWRDLFRGTEGRRGGGHEISLSTQGQASVGGARLSPQFQGVAGGMETVRGYRESPAAGDSVAVATLEYRWRASDWWRQLHKPGAVASDAHEMEDAGEAIRSRGASTQSDRDSARGMRSLGGAFRSTMPFEVGVRGFIDGGWVGVRRRPWDGNAEGDRSLAGAGVGMDMVFRGPVNGALRADLAFVLKEQPWAELGSSRMHVSFSLLW